MTGYTVPEWALLSDMTDSSSLEVGEVRKEVLMEDEASKEEEVNEGGVGVEEDVGMEDDDGADVEMVDEGGNDEVEVRVVVVILDVSDGASGAFGSSAPVDERAVAVGLLGVGNDMDEVIVGAFAQLAVSVDAVEDADIVPIVVVDVALMLAFKDTAASEPLTTGLLMLVDISFSLFSFNLA